MVRLGFVLFFLLLLPASLKAQNSSFDGWLQTVAQEAMSQGVSRNVIENALSGVELDPRVIELDQRQPEGTTTFAHYQKQVMTPARLKKGRALYAQYAARLHEVARREGVPAQVIVALWGIESSFGAGMGNFRLIDSLATLGFEGRRAGFFRKELISALGILEREGMTADELTGSWAGATGQCQFMPSTYLAHAADGDGDGKVDIWHNRADVFESIAHYLASEGWRRGEGWGMEVKLSKAIPAKYIGLDLQKTVKEWGTLGVHSRNNKPLAETMARASLVQPDGPGGRSFLVYDNFKALMKWNRSTYFATTVGLMSDAFLVRDKAKKK